MGQVKTIRARVERVEPLQVVCLAIEEWNIVQRLRLLRKQGHTAALIEFDNLGTYCRDVGRRQRVVVE